MHIYWDIVDKYYIQLFDKFSKMFKKNYNAYTKTPNVWF